VEEAEDLRIREGQGFEADIGQGVAAVASRHRVGDRDRAADIDRGVFVPRAAQDDGVDARAAVDRVVAGTAEQHVIARPAAEEVAALRARKGVVAAVPVEGVVARQPVGIIVGGNADDDLESVQADAGDRVALEVIVPVRGAAEQVEGG
jgi:hypothetical protein